MISFAFGFLMGLFTMLLVLSLCQAAKERE